MRLLLDTHALLWWQAGGQRLSARAARDIAKADAVLVSPISLWEIATLVLRGRILLDRDVHVWTRDLFDQERVEVAPITPAVAVTAALLGPRNFQGDPADRFLYATALESRVPLLTKDEAMHLFARRDRDVSTVW